MLRCHCDTALRQSSAIVARFLNSNRLPGKTAHRPHRQSRTLSVLRNAASFNISSQLVARAKSAARSHDNSAGEPVDVVPIPRILLLSSVFEAGGTNAVYGEAYD